MQSVPKVFKVPGVSIEPLRVSPCMTHLLIHHPADRLSHTHTLCLIGDPTLLRWHRVALLARHRGTHLLIQCGIDSAALLLCHCGALVIIHSVAYFLWHCQALLLMHSGAHFLWQCGALLLYHNGADRLIQYATLITTLWLIETPE